MRKHIKLIVAYLLISIPFIYLASEIDFWHNDEWIYYPQIIKILHGDFTLHPLMAPTFYSVGVIASLFSILFGISNLPYLTAIITISSCFILNLILIKHYKLNFIDSVLLSLLVFFNPLIIFTSMGFLTDNYFLFFCLLSIYFIYEFNEKSILKNFILINIFIILAYFTRQLGLVISLAFFFNVLKSKNFKYALIQGLAFLLLTMFHFFLFPKTGEMLETKFVFSNITYFRYIFSLGYVVLVYLGLFMIPLLVISILKSSLTKKNILVLLCLTTIVLVFMYFYFNNIGWIGEKLYYLKYTLNTNGFFVENLHGSKESFSLKNGLYCFLEIFTKFISVFSILLLLRKKKLKIDFNLFFIIIYFLTLLISVKVYDRYLIPLLPVVLFFLIHKDFKMKTLHRFNVGIFILLLGFYSYNFAADYVITNNYVWNKANSIEEINKGEIVATDAWRYLYPSIKDGHLYKFTYDKPSMKNYGADYILVDSKNIKYPLNIWNNKNTVYLYKYKF